MLIKWKDEFCIDNAAIDADHRNIIGRINHIAKAIRPGCSPEDIAWCLRDLQRVTKAHFFREEALQEASSFPFTTEHRLEHQRLLSSLKAHIDDVAAASTIADPKKVAQKLRICKSFLYRWILSHILDEDRKMAKYVDAMRNAECMILSPNIEDLIPYIEKIAADAELRLVG